MWNPRGPKELFQIAEAILLTVRIEKRPQEELGGDGHPGVRASFTKRWNISFSKRWNIHDPGGWIIEQLENCLLPPGVAAWQAPHHFQLLPEPLFIRGLCRPSFAVRSDGHASAPANCFGHSARLCTMAPLRARCPVASTW